MKESTKAFFFCLCLSTVLNFNFLTYDKSQNIQQLLLFDPIELNDKYYNDVLLITQEMEESKATACMILVRNNLYAVNEPLQIVLKETKFNKEDVFDRAILNMFIKCKLKITDKIIKDIFTLDNVTLIHNANRGVDLSIDKELLTNTKPVFSTQERELLKMIYGNVENKEEASSNTESKEQTQMINDSIYLEFIRELTLNKVKFIFIGLIAGLLLSLILSFTLTKLIKSSISKEVKDKDKKGKKLKSN